MNTPSRTRGRPKRVDDRQVLAEVLNVFWQKGYSGASLGDLAEAAKVSRPSLYEALGDKREMYRAALDATIDLLEATLAATLSAQRPLREELDALFAQSIALYCSGMQLRGCPVMCTAPAEALEEPMARAALARSIGVLDAAFEARFEKAKSAGEIAGTAEPRILAVQVTALLQSISLRARSGDNAAELSSIARSVIAQLASGNSR
jgi:AcrR family transcriptional regulator